MQKRNILIILEVISIIYAGIIAILFNRYYFYGKPWFFTMFYLVMIGFFLFAIIVFFTIFLIVKKKEKIVSPIGIGLVVFLIAASIPNIITITQFNKKISYTIEKWQIIEDEYKYYMAEDFLKKYDIIGMSKEDLSRYLGDDYTIFNAEEGIYYVYNFDYPVRQFAIDPYVLVILFTDNVVTSFSLGEG